MAGANGMSSKSGPSRVLGQRLLAGAMRVAKLNMDGVTKFQVAGSGKLYSTKESAQYVSNKAHMAGKLKSVDKAAAKARAKAPVAKLSMYGKTRFQAAGSGKLYTTHGAAQKAAGIRASKAVKATKSKVAGSLQRRASAAA